MSDKKNNSNKNNDNQNSRPGGFKDIQGSGSDNFNNISNNRIRKGNAGDGTDNTGPRKKE